MNIGELTNEQTRQMVDVRQAFEAWREARQEFLHGYGGSYKGKMKWRPREGRDYLYRVRDGVERSLGARSPETERIKDEYTAARNRLRTRLSRLGKRLDGMARVNRALRLNRLPRIAAEILRKIDDEGLVGRQLVVVGTNALFAYEARAGIQIPAGLLATSDFDFLYDARRALRFVSEDVKRDGIMGLLKSVDPTFRRSKDSYRAANDDGYMVDLIRPDDKSILRKDPDQLGDNEDDLQAAPIRGLHWLVNAPRFEEIVIGEDGLPLFMVTIDPRAYALHKAWIAKVAYTREPDKKKRDFEQALTVADVAKTYLRLNFRDKALNALHSELRDRVSDLESAK
jgi:hypothetical protein